MVILGVEPCFKPVFTFIVFHRVAKVMILKQKIRPALQPIGFFIPN
jgi:hypothetical protein